MLKLFLACVLLMGPCIVIGVFSLGLGMKFAKLQSIFLPCFFFFGQLVFCFLSLKNIPVTVRNVVIACTWRPKYTHAILFLLQVAFLMLSKQTIFPTLLQLLSQEWMILKSLITTCLLQIRYVHCNSFKMLS